MTVRRAINLLAGQGLVSTFQGRGTFVRGFELGEAVFRLRPLQSALIEENARVRILEACIVSANQRAARKLRVDVGTRVIYMRRQIFDGDKPVSYHREYLIYDPTRPIVESEMEVTALRALFEPDMMSRMDETRSELKRGNLSIEATVLSQQEAEFLMSTSGMPAFCIEHIFYDFDDSPISWGWFICRGDQLRFTAHLGIQEPTHRSL
jgi:GntR family transcriptional regulator